MYFSFSFERVVKMTGKQLSPTVYKLFNYIEESQKQANEGTQTKKKSVNTATMRTKVLRETRTIPKVVYTMEQFSKSMFQLSNKTKVDLAKYLGQGTVRDFRILNIAQVLESTGSDSNVSHITSTQSSVNKTVGQDEEMEIDNESDGTEKESDEDEVIPVKRSRV